MLSKTDREKLSTYKINGIPMLNINSVDVPHLCKWIRDMVEGRGDPGILTAEELALYARLVAEWDEANVD